MAQSRILLFSIKIKFYNNKKWKKQNKYNILFKIVNI